MDCKIKAKDGARLFPVHKIIVSLQSPVFRRLLDPAGPFREAASSGAPVELGEVSEEVLGIAIAFIYGKPLDADATLALVLDVAEFGHRMEINGLMDSAIAIACEKLRLSVDDTDFLAAIAGIRLLEDEHLLVALLARVSDVPMFVSSLLSTSAFISHLSKDEVRTVLGMFLESAAGNRLAGFDSAIGGMGAAFFFILQWAVEREEDIGGEKEATDVLMDTQQDQDSGGDDEVEGDASDSAQASAAGSDGAASSSSDGGSDDDEGSGSEADDGPSEEQLALDQIPSKVQHYKRVVNGEVEELLRLVDWKFCFTEDKAFIQKVLARMDLSSRFLQESWYEMWVAEREYLWKAIRSKKGIQKSLAELEQSKQESIAELNVRLSELEKSKMESIAELDSQLLQLEKSKKESIVELLRTIDLEKSKNDEFDRNMRDWKDEHAILNDERASWRADRWSLQSRLDGALERCNVSERNLRSAKGKENNSRGRISALCSQVKNLEAQPCTSEYCPSNGYSAPLGRKSRRRY